MFPAFPSLLSGAALMLLVGCARPSGNTPSPAEANNTGTTLEVVNRSSSDMDILAVRSGSRVRLGLAPSNVTTRFNILRGQLPGGGTVTFQARPQLGLARAISSEPTILSPGDTVTLEIPPP
jgi:hypothetical protein